MLGTKEEQEEQTKEIIEEWRDVPDFEGLYQVSNFGRLKSLKRKIRYITGQNKTFPEVVKSLKSKNQKGYVLVDLHKNNKSYVKSLHSIIAKVFLGERPQKTVIDHIDENKKNNRIDNLRYISNRENIVKSIDKTNKSSRFTGVFKIKAGRGRLKNDRFVARIRVGNKSINLGSFNTESEAGLAYQKSLIRYGIQLQIR